MITIGCYHSEKQCDFFLVESSSHISYSHTVYILCYQCSLYHYSAPYSKLAHDLDLLLADVHTVLSY